jgi:anti-sigma factor ChrR (cupin superfamily)
MQLNADFTQRCVVHGDELEWVPSPTAGVDRRMLDRIGDEVARATSIVRYAASSTFPKHTHSGGEEFFVLDGVFHDEHGSYPAGSYVRNPPQSTHAPFSEGGCVIFVKLWQFDRDDRTRIVIDTNKMRFVPSQGCHVLPLFHDGREDVRVERWPAGYTFTLQQHAGIELLVLHGELEAPQALRKHSWLRVPIGEACTVLARTDATVWIKTDHLRHIALPH